MNKNMQGILVGIIILAVVGFGLWYSQNTSQDVSASGKNYDIINPPLLNVDDNIGTGATGVCALKGNLQSIEIRKCLWIQVWYSGL